MKDFLYLILIVVAVGFPIFTLHYVATNELSIGAQYVSAWVCAVITAYVCDFLATELKIEL